MTVGRLADKVVILTGGTSGIGRACARLFCQEGAIVVIGANDDVGGASVVKEIEAAGMGKAQYIPVDVSEAGEVKTLVRRTLQEYERVDVLFGNAGILPLGTAWETSLETWQRCIDVNLSGNFFLAKYGITALMQSGGGVVLFTSSELGLVGTTAAVAYCAAKGGLINMARALAVDCAPHNIRVNCLLPGPISTPMSARGFQQASDPEEAERAQVDLVPLKRMGSAEEMARVALFLASDDSSYMTGSMVVADGGATAWYGL